MPQCGLSKNNFSDCINMTWGKLIDATTSVQTFKWKVIYFQRVMTSTPFKFLGKQVINKAPTPT